MLLSALFLACTGATDKSSTSSPTTTGDTGGPPPAPAVQVVPGDGWVDVAPLADVVATYNVPLDAASLDDAVASAIDGFGRAHPLELSLDDRVLVLRPLVPWPYDQSWTVDVTGLRLDDGAAAPEVHVGFTIHPELPLAESEYNLGRWVYAYEDGRLDRISRVRSGADGVHHTDDDLIEYTLGYEYDDQGRERFERTYLGPGDDGDWYTDDDFVYSWIETDWEQDRRVERTVFVGHDALPNTPDDIHYASAEIVFDEHGRTVRETRSSAPGADGIAFTADDEGLSVVVTTRDPYGSPVRTASASDMGSDGLPNTPDDVYCCCTEILRDVDGRQTGERDFGAGDDGTCFTGDDPLFAHGEVLRDALGLQTETHRYQFPGDDGVWKTGDDVLAVRSESTHDDRGQLVGYVLWRGPGGDQQWYTSDDFLDYQSRWSYDATGFPTRREQSANPGPDGVYFTADDGPVTTDTYAPPRVAGPR